MQIYVCGKRAIVHWGDEKRLWSLTSDGVATEQSHVQGDLVWMDGERGFNAGFEVGREEGWNEGYDAGVEDAVTSVASPFEAS